MKKVALKVLNSKEEWDGDLTLSVTKAKTFDLCKAKFKYCYIEKLPRKEWDFHIFGKFLHQVLENFHKALIKDEHKEPWQVVMGEAWKSAREKYHDSITAEQLEDAQAIIAQYKEIIKEEGIPDVKGVEVPFYINVDNELLLNGFIDRVQKDDDGVIHVQDYKTTKDKKYLKDFFQLQTYAFALMTADKSINRVRASFICLRHNFDYLTEEYTRDDVGFLAEKLLSYGHDIREEKLWRPSPQHLCKFCDYQTACQSGTDYLVKRGIIKQKPSKGFGFIKW